MNESENEAAAVRPRDVDVDPDAREAVIAADVATAGVDVLHVVARIGLQIRMIELELPRSPRELHVVDAHRVRERPHFEAVLILAVVVPRVARVEDARVWHDATVGVSDRAGDVGRRLRAWTGRQELNVLLRGEILRARGGDSGRSVRARYAQRDGEKKDGKEFG